MLDEADESVQKDVELYLIVYGLLQSFSCLCVLMYHMALEASLSALPYTNRSDANPPF